MTFSYQSAGSWMAAYAYASGAHESVMGDQFLPLLSENE
jgi:hypothetical protein